MGFKRPARRSRGGNGCGAGQESAEVSRGPACRRNISCSQRRVNRATLCETPERYPQRPK